MSEEMTGESETLPAPEKCKLAIVGVFWILLKKTGSYKHQSAGRADQQ